MKDFAYGSHFVERLNESDMEVIKSGIFQCNLHIQQIIVTNILTAQH
jgi:hypothetical protein